MDQYEIVHAGVREPVPHVKEGNASSGEIDTVAALKRRRVLIAVLVIVATVGALLVTRLMTPLYEAEAGIMFNPRELTLIGATTQQGTMLPSEETARKNYIAIVRSRALAEAVVDRLQLDKLPEFNPTLRPPSRTQVLADQGRAMLAEWAAPVLALLPLSMTTSETGWRTEELSQERLRDEIINRFLRRLETSSSDASRVIGIRFLSEDRDRSALIANTVAEQFMIRKRDQELAGAEVLSRNLTQEITELNKEIQDAERKVDERRLALGIDSDSSMKALNERMNELSRQLITVTAERVRAEAQFAEAQSVRNSGDVASAAQVLGSPLIQRLQEAAAMASGRLAQLQLRYNDGHPQMIAARSELRDIRAKIGEEMAKIQNGRHNAVAIAKANEDGLRQQVEILKGQMAKANASEVDVAVLEREVEAKRTLMPQLTARLNNANAQIDYLRHHGADTQVISQAVVPRFASHPPILAIMATAVVMAAGGGGVLAVMLERADNTIQSTSQLRRLTPLRVLGTLPVIRGRRRRQAPAQLVVEGSDSVFLEHLRTVALRAGVAGPTPVRVLLVTSSVSGEGKSSAASSLARMLALSGRRTIIIDADLRAPTMHRVFGLRRGRGLAEFIQDGLALEDIVQHDEASGTDVITAGHCRGASADVLQSIRMQELIGHLAIAYDTVIIDSPPVLAVCDAHILARLADRTLMMVRWKSTQVSTLVTALQRLSDDHVPVDGIVLSQVDSKKYSLYGYSDSEIFSSGFRKYYTH
jgi:capsular exopolysaccharide synthesis family protein